jgi:hypothetical protein
MEDAYQGPFTASDHTRLMKAVLEHPLHVIKYLSVPSGQSPSRLEVIDAALKVESFDAATKARLEAAREAYLLFEEEQAKDPATFTEHRDRMRAALEGKSIAEMITAIDYMLAQEGHGDNRWSAGLEFAKAILVDGADSIYSPDFPAYELMETATFAGHTTGAHATAQADIEFSPGTSSASAAAAGAFSAGYAIGVIYEAFFS